MTAVLLVVELHGGLAALRQITNINERTDHLRLLPSPAFTLVSYDTLPQRTSCSHYLTFYHPYSVISRVSTASHRSARLADDAPLHATSDSVTVPTSFKACASIEQHVVEIIEVQVLYCNTFAPCTTYEIDDCGRDGRPPQAEA